MSVSHIFPVRPTRPQCSTTTDAAVKALLIRSSVVDEEMIEARPQADFITVVSVMCFHQCFDTVVSK